jgi:hypothetical protein
MASSSIFSGIENNPLSNIKEVVQHVISDCDTLDCEGVPCHLWTNKSVSLHNEIGVVMGEGICYSIKSDLIVGSTRPLGDTHFVVQILKNLKADEFPNDWRYSIRAWSIFHVFNNSANLFNHKRQYRFNC